MPPITLKLYNSMSRAIEPIRNKNQPLSVYVCGITPYDTTHVGHAFTYASADNLIRYLLYKGNRVRYVQNVTDIDDDILKRAKKVGENWKVLGDRWTAHFIQDMIALNVRAPDAMPRATDVIPQIIDAVQTLIAVGAGYVVGGNVYFSIEKFSKYGELSRLSVEEMGPVAAERGNYPDDPNKKNPLDFVLWQAQKPGEPTWESPWGLGRPGWHIECSTMAHELLGGTVDIHSGGDDLIFPHHESEIAQAEAANPGKEFVHHWMHIAMVEFDGDKMSKSLGNLVMVRDLLKDWEPKVLRYYLASYHHREVWTYNPEQLAESARRVSVLEEAINAAGGSKKEFDYGKFIVEFEKAMDNDLNTPKALLILGELAESILKNAASGSSISGAQDALSEIAQVLGIRLGNIGAVDEIRSGWLPHLARFQPPAS